MNKTLTLGKNRYPPFQQVLCVENSSGLAAWNGQPAVLKALIGIRKWLASGVCLVPKMVSGIRVNIFIIYLLINTEILNVRYTLRQTPCISPQGR